MCALPLRVSGCSGEHAISLASRLAAVNFVSLEEILRDFSISARELVDGEPAAVLRVTGLAGVEAAPYLAATPHYDRRRVRVFCGHSFPAAAFHGAVMRACPLCLAGDETPYLRAKWALNALTVCTKHGIPLRPLW